MEFKRRTWIPPSVEERRKGTLVTSITGSHVRLQQQLYLDSGTGYCFRLLFELHRRSDVRNARMLLHISVGNQRNERVEATLLRKRSLIVYSDDTSALDILVL